VDNLLKVKEFLEKTVNRMGEENIALETVKAEQEAKLAKNETELKSFRTQLMTQRKLARDDTERIGIELDSLKSESEQAGKRERELFNRNMLLEKELEAVKDALRTVRRESERDKANLEQTMRMCETYESKVTAAARKERSFVEILDQSKEKLDGLLLERDKALLKVDRLEKALEESGLRQRE
jgi:chromosome segregation ATPase